MKKIGIISDTHIPRTAVTLPETVAGHFEGVDLILHAGDLEVASLLDDLESIAPVKAVCGNMDRDRDMSLMPDRRIVDVEECRIGLIHGWGAPNDLHLRVRKEFDDEMDCIVFGHSHQSFNEKVAGVLMFNPGSPTDKRFAPFRSVGILTVDGRSVKGDIIRI
jgi:uncharacterized protein